MENQHTDSLQCQCFITLREKEGSYNEVQPLNRLTMLNAFTHKHVVVCILLCFPKCIITSVLRLHLTRPLRIFSVVCLRKWVTAERTWYLVPFSSTPTLAVVLLLFKRGSNRWNHLRCTKTCAHKKQVVYL